MRFKNINKLLSVGILLNSFNLNSFAGVLSKDGRYEYFEGNNITINDVLEEDTVDIEVEGNTLINTLRYNSVNDFTGFAGTLYDDGYMEFETNGTDFKNFFVKKDSIIVKPNTEYTFFVEVAENTLKQVDSNYTYAFIFGASHEIEAPSLWTNFKTFSHNTKPGVYKFTLTTKGSFDGVTVGDRGFVNMGYSGKLKFRYMIIEGNHKDKDIDFFKGMKSVGEVENLSITSQNKNLIPIDDYVNWNSVYKDVSVKKESNGLRLNGVSTRNSGDLNIEFIPQNKEILLSPGKIYRIHFELLEGSVTSSNNQSLLENYAYKYQSPDGTIGWNTVYKVPIIDCRNNTDFAKISWIRLYSYTTESLTFNNALYQIQLEEISEDDMNKEVSFVQHKSNSKEFILSEPLRGLPSGVKDRIVNLNGQWVIERNYVEVTLNGSENWGIPSNAMTMDNLFTFECALFDYLAYGYGDEDCIANNFITNKYNTIYFNQISGIGVKQHQGTVTMVRINIEKNKLDIHSLSGFKTWLSNNNIKLVFRLANPIYEPLNIDSTLNIYKDKTYITSNSAIPVNIKIIIDRTLNRAIEAAELAQINPTIDNISQARYWSNLLSESINKDYLQNTINSINTTSDIGNIEPISVSSNSDIYIKGKNTLSLSLDTNNITFEDFDGTEDVELHKAINLMVSSSLPYDIKSTLATDISNSDKSIILNPMILNIKSSNSNNYKSFTSVGDELVLVSNESSGTNRSHNLDLMLDSGVINEVDVYKATIKFEVIQK